MSAVLELLLDDLGKEAKEGPGWITLWISCNLALWWNPALAEPFGERAHDTTTIATAASIVLFFLGDTLDIVVFPRSSRDGGRAIRNLMVVSFTIGTFSLFAKQPTVVVLALAPWLLLVPLHRNLTEQETRRGEQKKKRGDKVECQPVRPEAPKDHVGWMVLKTSGLDKERSDAVHRLGVASGIYDVSKALAKRADRYFFKPPWIENESSKFVRSLVPLCWLVAAWLVFDRELAPAALTALASVALLFAYGRLKSHHMQVIYAFANTQRIAINPIETSALATWNGDPVAWCDEGRWRELPDKPTSRPYPTAEGAMH
jgi:hypothetical protein